MSFYKIEDREASGKHVTKVKIKEEDVLTGAHYQTCSFEVDAVEHSGAWTELDISWPIAISILNAQWVNEAEHVNDIVQIAIAPDTSIGTITQDVAIDDTEITVSQAVIDNIEIGFWATIGSDDMGMVLSKDTSNLTITVNTAPQNVYLASAPTTIKQTVKMTPNLKLKEGPICIGASKVGGSNLPANTTLRIKYQNNGGASKKLSFILEYLY